MSDSILNNIAGNLAGSAAKSALLGSVNVNRVSMDWAGQQAAQTTGDVERYAFATGDMTQATRKRLDDEYDALISLKRGIAITAPIVIALLCWIIYSNTTNESIKSVASYTSIVSFSWLVIGSIYVFVHTWKIVWLRKYNWEFQKEKYLIDEYKKLEEMKK